MHARTATAAALLLAATLTACSSSETKPDAKSSGSATASASTAAPTKLEPVWAPKLQAAQEGAVEACMTPSSDTCATSLDRIMTVVDQLNTAIEATGRRYPQSTAQIVKMQDAHDEYTENACAGDPAADDPNGPCWDVSAITIGASTLQMTLITDDLST